MLAVVLIAVVLVLTGVAPPVDEDAGFATLWLRLFRGSTSCGCCDMRLRLCLYDMSTGLDTKNTF